jgi:hypothetical protein
MVDIDARFTYSQIIRFVRDEEEPGISYDVSGAVYITSRQLQQAMLYNSNGQLLRKIILKPGRQMLPVNKLSSGLYFLKTPAETLKIIRH